MEFAQIRKAIVPLVVGVIVAALPALGLTDQMSLGDAISFVVTAILVYWVPNKKSTK